MALLKTGVSYGPVILSKFIFSCPSCDKIDIISEKDYTLNMQKKCPACQSIMILQSANTETDESENNKQNLNPITEC